MSAPFLAEIRIVSFNYAPRGWALCNGQSLPINQNQALFALLGTMYGGNGQTTFALPNFRGRAPVHVGTDFIQGQNGGAESHTLNQGELAAHTHAVGAYSGTGDKTTPVGNVWASRAANPYHPTADTTMQVSTTPSGGSHPHTNMQPYLVLNFIIALQGIFPSP